MYFTFLLTLAIFSSVHCAHVDIVGGDTVDIKDYKYQVILLMDGKVWCGGSILSEKYVLTAAHCCRLAFSLITIRAGSSFWDEGGSIHDVDFNTTYSDLKIDDIGLMRVVQPFVFDDTRQPIPIATPDTKMEAGAMAVVSGWGSTEGGSFPHQLKAVEVPIVDRDTCSKDYSKNSRFGKIADSQMCAGITRKDSCQGDSGSPLVLNGVQIGVTSMGNGCGLPNYPGIYADVGYFNDWIQKHMAESS